MDRIAMTHPKSNCRG